MTSQTHTLSDTTDTDTTDPVGTPDLPDDVAAIAPTARKPRGVKSFADIGVDADLVAVLTARGFDAPFPIQELTLPLATKGHDVIGQARTGTGKTLAFALALLSRVTPGGGTQALVVVPTRELCIQVAEEMQIGKARGLRTIAVYGGVGYEEQEAAFRGGHEIVVGTPGRLLDHLNKGNLKLAGVTELVLDEADEMLDMGFLPDVERLIEACASDRHGMLFSATMPTEVVRLARRYLDHPTFMRADNEPVQTAPNVTQHFFQVHRMDKPRVLARILQTPDRGGVYVFVRTKHMADRLVRELDDLNTPAVAVHGDLRQAMREKNLDRFRDGSANVLVATEVAARGLDVENVTHVVNYDCPDDEKMYLHRIGRTARAGNEGVAVTFAEFNEIDRLNVVRKKLGEAENAIVSVFSPSEILTDRFDLPTERPWDEQVAGSKAGTRTDRRATTDDDRDGRARGGKSGRGGGRDGSRGGGRDRVGGRDRSGGRDRGGAGGGRENRTDGRPKSKRSSEGTGNDRDADRSRRDRSEAAPRPSRDDRSEAAPRPSRDDRTDTSSGSDTTSQRGSTPEPDTADDATTRTRTRTRTRTASGNDRQRAASGGARKRAPADGREHTDAGRERTAGDDRADASGNETDAAPRRTAGGRSRGGRSRDGRDDGRSSGQQDEARRDRGGQRSRSGRDGRTSRGDTARGDGAGRSDDRGDRGGSRKKGRGDDRPGGGRDGGRQGGRTDDPTVVTARRGDEARGDGSPAFARRVKVEHLP